MKMPPFDKIRKHYEHWGKMILEANPARRWVDPYWGVDWFEYFSPIEQDTWNVIRSFGKAPLYPQYPVGNYFLDFGNPKVRVGLECDGKQWHKDKAKDYYRDANIFNESGEWHIYRTSGSECYAVTEKYDDRHEYEDDDFLIILYSFYKTMEGLVKAIAIFYFDYEENYLWNKELDIAFKCLLNHASIAQSKEIEKHLYYKYGKLLERYFSKIED